jgi:flagellar basal-body rod modification protein FlgD
MSTSLFTSTQNSTGTAGGVAGQDAVAAASTGSDSISTMFTQLLVAQIKNQDPTSPTDPSTYVNQLAQLSQTESMQTLSSQSSANGSIMQSLQLLTLGSQVGSDVMVKTSTLSVGTDAVQGAVTLQNASAKTTLVLTGTDQQEHRFELGTQPPGEVDFNLDPAVVGLAPGSYAMRVETDSKEVPTIEIAGRIGSVKVSATGSPVITVSHVGDVAPSALTRFNGHPATTPG